MLPECSLRSYWMYELTEIYNGEVMLHSMLAHNEAICAAVERSRDYIMITNKNHMIRVSRRLHPSGTSQHFFLLRFFRIFI